MTSTPKSFATQVSEIAQATDLSNSLTAPLKRAIDELLRLASQAVGSAVASVLVRDGNEGGLKFLTATSGVTDELLALRLPPGAGIAGLVFSTTQPMAVADVSQEGSFWSEADRRTGFKTVTLLATPLRANREKELREWLKSSSTAGTHRDLALLWISMREIVTRGDAERELCRDLLETLARFTEKRSGSSFGF